MKNLIFKLRNSPSFKRTFFVLLCVTLGLYFFSLPSFSDRVKWNYVSYGLMAVLTVLTATYIFIYSKFKFDRKIIIPFIFVVDAFICTMIMTPGNWRMWLSVFFVALTFVVVFYSARCIDNQRLIFKILLFAFLGFAVYFVVIPEYFNKVLTFSISMKDRLGGYFSNENLVGSYFAIGFGLALYVGLINKRKIEYLYLLACLPFLYLGLFTGSRAYLILVLTFAVSIFYLKFKHRKLLYFLILGGIILVSIFLIIFIKPLNEQFEKTIYTLFGIGKPDPKNIETSAIQRTLWMQYGFNLGSKHIIIGYGCDGFAKVSGIGAYTHNNFAELLCDFGIPGLLSFYFIILYPFMLHFVSKKECNNFVVPITIYFIVKSMFGVFYNYKDFYLLVAVCYYLVDDVSFDDFINKISHKFKTKKPVYQSSETEVLVIDI